MVWKGKFIGALIGFLVTRNIWGAVMGAIVGHMFDESVGARYANSPYAAAHAAAGGNPYADVSEVFFRTTFELMGHVAKSDGHVSEREIGAAYANWKRQQKPEIFVYFRDLGGAPPSPGDAERLKRIKAREGIKIGGVINVGVGIGLLIFLGALVSVKVALCGLIPGLIGVAMLIYAYYLAAPVEQ